MRRLVGRVIDAYGGSGIAHCCRISKKTLTDSYGILSADEDATLPLYFNPNYSIETNAWINSLKLPIQRKRSQCEQTQVQGVLQVFRLHPWKKEFSWWEREIALRYHSKRACFSLLLTSFKR